MAEVYFAELAEDRNKAGAPGETVYFPHTLTNTGNSEDTYTISADNGYVVYRDTNGNGLPDAGEPVAGDITLNAGEQVELVVAVPIPASAQAGDTYNSKLTVISANSAEFTDLTGGGGADDTENTNDDVVTVTEDAVLVPTKSAVVDRDNNTITYTLQVTNTGSRAATEVDIFDAFPVGTTFVEINSVNGLLAGNSDQADYGNGLVGIFGSAYDPNDANTFASFDENGIDLNGNGATGDTVDGIFYRDAELPANTTVSIEFTVSFDPTSPAGTKFINTFAAQGNLDDDPNTTEDPVPSNPVTTTVDPSYGVDARDTGDAAKDDDDGLNDIALQDSAPSGGTAVFGNVIENTGNATDTFDLTINNDGNGDPAQVFPTGTIFEFWNAANNTQLTDTNGNGIPDTGSIASGESREIRVRAKLPSGVVGGPYIATMTATSGGDPSVSDTKLEQLDEILPPTIDLANSFTSDLTDATNADEYNASSPITTLEADVGGTVTFPLFAANNSGNSDSFILGADLPEGWNVTFRELGVDVDGNGSLNDAVDNTANAGSTVTSTPNIPGDAVYHYEAVVQVSSVVSQALADFKGTVAGIDATDGGADTSISPSDGDGDYPIRFTIDSSSSNASDQKLDAVDVKEERNIAVTPDGQNQVQPGGNVDYKHVLANRGNTTEEVTLTTTNSEDGFSNNTQLFDVAADKWVNIENLSGTVDVRAPDGSTVTVEIDNTGDPKVTLEPGERLDVKTTVFAPASAGQGDTDTYTLTATTEDGNIKDIATDTTEVITGQVRLQKSAFVDTDCDCAADMPYDASLFSIEPADQVKPDQCVVWRLVALNQGTTEARSVTINDSVTEFTELVAADAAYAADGSTLANAPALSDAPDLEWDLGANSLASGASASAQFCVKVQ